jgi:hypothetical protein
MSYAYSFPFVGAQNVAGFGADLTSGYSAARNERLARQAQQAALVSSQTPMVRLDPVMLPPEQPFPKALAIALGLAGLAAVGVVAYAFVKSRGKK